MSETEILIHHMSDRIVIVVDLGNFIYIILWIMCHGLISAIPWLMGLVIFHVCYIVLNSVAALNSLIRKGDGKM